MIYLLSLPFIFAVSWFILVVVIDIRQRNRESIEDSAVWHYQGMILPKVGEQIYTFVYYSAQGSEGTVTKLVFRKHLETVVSTNIEVDSPLHDIMTQAQLSLLKDNSYENFEREWSRVHCLVN